MGEKTEVYLINSTMTTIGPQGDLSHLPLPWPKTFVKFVDKELCVIDGGVGISS